MIELVHVSDLHLGKSKNRTRKAQRLLKKIQASFPFQQGQDIHLLVTGDIIHNLQLGKSVWKEQFRFVYRGTIVLLHFDRRDDRHGSARQTLIRQFREGKDG